MKRRYSNIWERYERESKIVNRIVFSIIIFIAFLTILSTVFTGVVIIKFFENPEMIGDWINRLISGLEGTK
jgi:predicted cation transporter